MNEQPPPSPPRESRTGWFLVAEEYDKLIGLAAEAVRQRESLLAALIAVAPDHEVIAGLKKLDVTPLLPSRTRPETS